MKTHVVIWTIVGVALLSAGAVAYFRYLQAEAPPLDVTPEEQIEFALALLVEDPLAIEPETQNAVRAAAVLTEGGWVRAPEANYVLALQYQRESNVPFAEALYKRAIAEAPDWSWPYAGLGTLLSRNTWGREQEAREALEIAIELDPYWAKPRNSLAVLLRAMGYLEEAAVHAEFALELEPDDISVQNNYANLLVAQGRLEAAEPHYLHAIALNPEHPKPYYNLACLYSLMAGRTEEALDALEQAILRAGALRAEAAVDPDLQNIRYEPRFQELVFGQDDEFADLVPPEEEAPAAENMDGDIE